jgi:hypothetical protein
MCPPAAGERGTAVDRRNLLFAEWDDRLYLHDPSRPSDRDLDRMLERDGKARQLEQALTLPLRQAKWTLKPGKGDRGELEFVREALTTPANAGGMSTPIQQIVSQATSAVSHRRSFHEKVWAEGRPARLRQAGLASADHLPHLPRQKRRVHRLQAVSRHRPAQHRPERLDNDRAEERLGPHPRHPPRPARRHLRPGRGVQLPRHQSQDPVPVAPVPREQRVAEDGGACRHRRAGPQAGRPNRRRAAQRRCRRARQGRHPHPLPGRFR